MKKSSPTPIQEEADARFLTWEKLRVGYLEQANSKRATEAETAHCDALAQKYDALICDTPAQCRTSAMVKLRSVAAAFGEEEGGPVAGVNHLGSLRDAVAWLDNPEPDSELLPLAGEIQRR